MSDTLRAARVVFMGHSRVASLLTSDPQEMHAFTMKALDLQDDIESARAESNLLWRLDHRQGRATMVVQSTSATANFEAWSSAAGVHEVQVVDDLLARINDRLVPGGLLRFSVRANPVRWNGSRREKTGRRVPITQHDQQIEWLARQGEGAFVLAPDPFTGLPDVLVEHEGLMKVEPRGISFNVTSFKGTLEVTNSDAMKALLRRGLGRGRAFGLGLLQVA